MTEWWKQSVEAVLAAVASDARRGLTDAEAARRLAESGPNKLHERGTKSPWAILREQLSGVMVVILIVAGVVSAAVGEVVDATVIGIIVVLNALLGLVQEYRAEKAMAALQRMAVPVVRLRRDGHVREIPAHDLVAGDIVLLEAGNLVPADCRLIEAANLSIQESTLTGESEAVEKHVEALPGGAAALGDRRNMAYLGTVVTYGRGVAVVVATGMRTELGGIATLIQHVTREGTPLQKRLAQLGKGLAVTALVLVAIIFAQGLLLGGTGAANVKLMFLTAISMAVAAVPEGLPAVVTIALALGAQRMLRRHALVRRLLAVETLGSVTVICTDKTGTLTENRMTVTRLAVGGVARELSAQLADRAAAETDGTAALLSVAALCNDAVLQPAVAGGGAPVMVGDPTEGALLVAAAAADLRKDALEAAFPRLAERPFDSDRKRMTTLHRWGEAGTACRALLPPGASPPSGLACCKGAADSLLGVCTAVWTASGHEPLTAARRAEIRAANDRFAQDGMRVLGVAFRLLADNANEADPEHDLVFLGLVGMIDPPRAEVKDAVAVCRAAGIRPVMITGDHPLTARAIAAQLGIAVDGEALTGTELDALTDEELRKRVNRVSVYARVSPAHKLRIVTALQQRGHVVAMTGDGVNDAPALRKADIGVAMGITGTDVSKEAADMVLRDDNFATIVAAVEEGRVIYGNIRKFIRYLLGTNSGELWTMLLAPLVGLPLPLLPIQILWINLVTDGLPALALSVEPAERDVMRRPPRHPKESIFSEGLGWHVLWVGILMAAVTLGVGVWYGGSGRLNLAVAADIAYYRTMAFTLMTTLQMGHVMAIRSHRQSLFHIGLGSNRPLLWAVVLTLALQVALVYVPLCNRMFQTVPLAARDLIACLGLGTSVFVAVELEKWFRRRGRRHHRPHPA